jgi:ribosomal protein S12 methylthiotransferase
MEPLSVGFISLGCAKNLVDSEHMASVLRADGLRLAPSPEAADVILINTCSFIGDAKQESIDTILRACARKAEGRCRAVVVAGCLPQRYQRELQELLPEVDAFVGLDRLDAIARIVRRLARDGRAIYEVPRTARRRFSPPRSRVLLTGGPHAYLKIAEGCNHRCAFCAIPLIRGRYRSRRIADIVREAEDLLAHGIRELDLISQDTTAYGRDLHDDTSLPNLLRALGRIGGRFWIRVLYSHPSSVTEALLETMSAIPQVCHYLDVPIQHSHPTMLRAMQRAGSARAVRALTDRVRRVLPDVSLRTTCLVGFPGETETHFRDLLAYIRETEFDHLGVFAFSREENTPAYDLSGQVPLRTALARRDRLMRAQQAVVRRKAAGRVGQRDVVLLEKPRTAAGQSWVSRAAGQGPEVDGCVIVRAAGPESAAGQFIDVRYTRAADYDMLAVPA